MKQALSVILILAAILAAACGPEPAPTAAPTGPAAGLPNPASKYCADQGYKLEIRDEAGGQVGYCLFPDGSECEEWAFFRGECGPTGGKEGAGLPNPASKYCADRGYKLRDSRRIWWAGRLLPLPRRVRVRGVGFLPGRVRSNRGQGRRWPAQPGIQVLR